MYDQMDFLASLISLILFVALALSSNLKRTSIDRMRRQEDEGSPCPQTSRWLKKIIRGSTEQNWERSSGNTLLNPIKNFSWKPRCFEILKIKFRSSLSNALSINFYSHPPSTRSSVFHSVENFLDNEKIVENYFSLIEGCFGVYNFSQGFFYSICNYFGCCFITCVCETYWSKFLSFLLHF